MIFQGIELPLQCYLLYQMINWYFLPKVLKETLSLNLLFSSISPTYTQSHLKFVFRPHQLLYWSSCMNSILFSAVPAYFLTLTRSRVSSLFLFVRIKLLHYDQQENLIPMLWESLQESHLIWQIKTGKFGEQNLLELLTLLWIWGPKYLSKLAKNFILTCWRELCMPYTCFIWIRIKKSI